MKLNQNDYKDDEKKRNCVELLRYLIEEEKRLQEVLSFVMREIK